MLPGVASRVDRWSEASEAQPSTDRDEGHTGFYPGSAPPQGNKPTSCFSLLIVGVYKGDLGLDGVEGEIGDWQRWAYECLMGWNMSVIPLGV